MAKSKIEKRNQVVIDALSEAQNYLIGKLPLGDELLLIMNARGNIRKERMFRFFESFRLALQELSDKELDIDEITSEEFIDVMEAVLVKVQLTKSESKIERFRNILLRQILHQSRDYDLTLKYIDLVNELSDVQILILSKLQSTELPFFSHAWEVITDPLTVKTKKDYDFIDVSIDGFTGRFIRSDLELFSNQLVSFGLVREFHKSSGKYDGGGTTKKRYQISPAGRLFLQYIETHDT